MAEHVVFEGPGKNPDLKTPEGRKELAEAIIAWVEENKKRAAERKAAGE